MTLHQLSEHLGAFGLRGAQASPDPDGLSVFMYFVMDLKKLVISLTTLHFRVSFPHN